MLLPLLSTALLFAFILCCVVSAVLQILAWSRHSREGVAVSVRALWKPEGYFDEIGRRQIGLARRLITVGGMAYLLFGALLVVARLTSAT
jgi:hypothetical protein